MGAVTLTTHEEIVLGVLQGVEDGASEGEVTNACLFVDKPIRPFAALEVLFDLLAKGFVERAPRARRRSCATGPRGAAPQRVSA